MKQFIHDVGVALFGESNYSYLRRLFIRFYHGFGIKHVVIGVAVAMTVYMVLLVWQRRKNTTAYQRISVINGKSTAAAILAVYYYLLILYTIVFRPVYGKPQYRLEIFWSYKQAFNGSSYLFYEIVLNYILLMPVGMLVPVFKKEHSFKVTVLVGCLSSVAIECMQLLLRRGLFEFDDIIGNVFGVVAGYGIYRFIHWLMYRC